MNKNAVWVFVGIVALVLGFFLFRDYLPEIVRGEVKPGQTVVRAGVVTTINLEPMTVDGPALITLEVGQSKPLTIAIPSMGLPFCAGAGNIMSVSKIKVGDKIQVKGTVGEDGAIVPCEAADHYLRLMARPNVSADVPKEATLTGEYLCLPHRDTSGPQTLECALGIKTAGGLYYALDLGELLGSDFDVKFPVGTRITIRGLLVPIEAISSDEWQKYPIEGIMKVETVTKAS